MCVDGVNYGDSNERQAFSSLQYMAEMIDRRGVTIMIASTLVNIGAGCISQGRQIFSAA